MERSTSSSGAAEGGAREVPVSPGEVDALESMIEISKRGDVLAVTALSQRPELFALLKRRRAVRLGPQEVRVLVRAASGT